MIEERRQVTMTIPMAMIMITMVTLSKIMEDDLDDDFVDGDGIWKTHNDDLGDVCD